MKKSTKILLWISAGFISLGIILTAGGVLTGANPIKAFREGMMDFTIYERRSNKFSPDGRYVVPADNVKEIDIDWMDGSITIEPYDGTEVIIEEKCNKPFDEHNSLTYSKQKDILAISYAPHQTGISFKVRESALNKNLHIMIPGNIKCKKIELSAAGSDIVLKNINAKYVEADILDGDFLMTDTVLESLLLDSAGGSLKTEESDIGIVEADTVDGDLSVSDLNSEKLSFNTAGGNLKVMDSHIKDISFEAIDGNFNGNFKTCPEKVCIDTAGGNSEIYLPEDSSFTARIDSLDGKIDSDFSGTYSQGVYTVGSGSAQIDVDTISGELRIFKCSEL